MKSNAARKGKASKQMENARFFAAIGSNSSYVSRHDGQVTKLKTSIQCPILERGLCAAKARSESNSGPIRTDF